MVLATTFLLILLMAIVFLYVTGHARSISAEWEVLPLS